MAHVGEIVAQKGSSLPNWGCWGIDVTDTVIDYDSGTFTITIRQAGTVVVTSGLTGTAQTTPSGDGSGASDTPTLIVARALTTTLDALDTGPAELVVLHSSGRRHKFPMLIED